MPRRKVGGYIFVEYLNDHPPRHVHIFRGRRELGRFDIENQVPMDPRLKLTGPLRRALRRAGYLR